MTSGQAGLADLDVIIVTRVLVSGGAEHQALQLAGRLASEGVRTGLLTFRVDPIELPEGVILLRADRLHLPRSRLYRRVTGLIGRAIERPARAVLRLAARAWASGSSPVLRRALDATAAWSALRSFAAQGTVIRHAVEVTGASTIVTFLPSMNGGAAAGLWSSGVRWIASERSDPTKGALKPHWAEMRHLVARRADVFGANSRGAADWLQEELHPDRQTTSAVTPNISLDPPPAPAPTADRFLIVSRLLAGKGIETAIEVFAGLREELAHWELLIAGEGSHHGELERLIHALHVQGRCRLLGRVDTWELLSGGGVLLHVSVREGMPNAVMEAMAWGVPSIVSDASPGPVELIGGRAPAGIVVPFGDTGQLEEAMR